MGGGFQASQVRRVDFRLEDGLTTWEEAQTPDKLNVECPGTACQVQELGDEEWQMGLEILHEGAHLEG